MAPQSKPQIRWGILGAGHIARKFIESARAVESANVAAIASRSSGPRPAELAREYGIESSYPNYESLLEEDSIDAVYVANTHNFHVDTVCLALESGKAVLSEKPLAVNAAQARRMIDLARSKKQFLMEGMWTRFLPAVGQLREWLKAGRIGRPLQMRASFGLQRGEIDPQHRLVNPDLAGGALLDHGIYPLSMASMVFDAARPEEIVSMVRKGPTGVDVDSVANIRYPSGATAHLWSSFETALPNTVEIIGEEGRLLLPELFLMTDSVELIREDERIMRRFPYPQEEGFRYEIEAVHRCLAEGELECSLMPLDESLLLAETTDAIRKQWGIKYPFE